MSDQHVACLFTVTLEHHWRSARHRLHRGNTQGRDGSITMTRSGPISPRLLAQLKQLQGAEVLDRPRIQERSARATGYAK